MRTRIIRTFPADVIYMAPGPCQAWFDVIEAEDVGNEVFNPVREASGKPPVPKGKIKPIQHKNLVWMPNPLGELENPDSVCDAIWNLAGEILEGDNEGEILNFYQQYGPLLQPPSPKLKETKVDGYREQEIDGGIVDSRSGPWTAIAEGWGFVDTVAIRAALGFYDLLNSLWVDAKEGGIKEIKSLLEIAAISPTKRIAKIGSEPEAVTPNLSWEVKDHYIEFHNPLPSSSRDYVKYIRSVIVRNLNRYLRPDLTPKMELTSEGFRLIVVARHLLDVALLEFFLRTTSSMGRVCENCGRELPLGRRRFCSDKCKVARHRKEHPEAELKNKILSCYRNQKKGGKITPAQYEQVKRKINELWKVGIRTREEIIERLG